MGMLMFLAFLGTRLTDDRTSPGEFGHERRISRHRLGEKRTDGGALPVEPDAVNHHLDVMFFQARLETVITRLHTIT